MHNILVTGANKGIGLAVVEAILREQPRYRVILGSRDLARGKAAREGLVDREPAWSERVEVLKLDVTSDQSVAAMQAALAARGTADSPTLYGLVNNAGVGSGSIREVLDVNLYGLRRVCDACAPLLEDGGRIVNVTSAAGPNFVADCDAARRAFFLDPAIDWERLEQFLSECIDLSADGFAALGMGRSSPYGLSKACANSYTVVLARNLPHLFVNACTPGFIETDLGKEFLGDRTPAEVGMKSPAQGARVIMHLLFGDLPGSGYYYGSDSLRSPMDRYRAPGSPEFIGN